MVLKVIFFTTSTTCHCTQPSKNHSNNNLHRIKSSRASHISFEHFLSSRKNEWWIQCQFCREPGRNPALFKKKHTFQNHTGNQFNLESSLYICDLQINIFMNGNSTQWKTAVLNVLQESILWLLRSISLQRGFSSWCQISFLLWITFWCWFQYVRNLEMTVKYHFFLYIYIYIFLVGWSCIANAHQNISEISTMIRAHI